MAHPTPSTQHPSSNSTPLRTPIHVACLSNLTPSTEARKAILEGDWTEVEKHCRRWTEDVSKTTSSQQKTFLYAIYREQYLELIEGQEYQKAFTHLTKRLKPLEGSAASEGEFRDLCYLLTCKSVQEVLRGWEGVAAAREQLVQAARHGIPLSQICPVLATIHPSCTYPSSQMSFLTAFYAELSTHNVYLSPS
uniref:CTLH domain-containing protein n=1 Tax=Haptolina ericina TaxID=156174 RepID=A0A6T9Q0C4_9EUKA|mmetsp:Transcript_9725/g.22058  ORF Transcript_9725/g.22058 Transcript_9725/m.22058 type:complete len:193 (+) Transcript_9725:225-803(+)